MCEIQDRLQICPVWSEPAFRWDSGVRLLPEAHIRTILPIHQTRISAPSCSELEIMVSVWWSVTAVSLIIGGGVPPILNRQNCTCARKNTRNSRGRTHSAGCTRLWFCTPEHLGERRYENCITKWKLSVSASKIHLAKTSLDPELYCIVVLVFI